MKHLLLSIVLIVCCFPFLSAQIEFENLGIPNEFTIEFAYASPGGEIFLLPSTETIKIYSSTDHQNWEESNVYSSSHNPKMIFFNDDTPLIVRSGFANIRRNGQWEFLEPVNGSSTQAATIVNDTLYFVAEDAIYYSTDKGITYTHVLDIGFVPKEVDLKVYKNKILITYKVGHLYYARIYNENELLDEIELEIAKDLLNINTHEAIVEGYNNWLYYDLETLEFNFFAPLDNFDNYNSRDNFITSDDYFYRVTKSQVYRSDSFFGIWQEYKTVPESIIHNFVHVDYNENLIGHENHGFMYFINEANQESWLGYNLEIAKPLIDKVIGSKEELIVCSTPNFIYRKTNSTNWVRDESIDERILDISFNSSGWLFVTLENSIIYSQDGSSIYEDLILPAEYSFNREFSSLRVLENGVLLLLDSVMINNYYSTNNGESWLAIPPDFLYISANSIVCRLVGDEVIFIATGDDEVVITYLNIESEETEKYDVENVGVTDKSVPVIHSNGHIVFENFTGIYTFNRENGLLYLMEQQGWENHQQFISIHDKLYRFNWDVTEIIENGSLYDVECIGLNYHNHDSYLAHSGHVLIIGSDEELYKTTKKIEPLDKVVGTIKYDTDSNCSDEDEYLLNNWQVNIKSDELSRTIFTSEAGSYETSLPIGDYTVTVVEPNSLWDLCDDSMEVTIEPSQNTMADFLTQAEFLCGEILFDFSTPFLRRCFDNRYSFHLENKGTVTLTDVEVNITLDPFFNLLNVSMPYVDNGDNTLTINIENLSISEEVRFYIEFNLSCDAELGQTHCLDATVNAEGLCPNGSDRLAGADCQENIGAYDPNDKRCFNEEGMESDLVDLDEYFYYHIRFQNTGTDTAFNIKVYDPLSEKFDLSTFVMLSSSHENEYQITDGPQLEVFFDNIMLPDSTTNLVESNGYFKFRIKPLAEYAYGESFENEAAIYFDFNEPIFTNTTETVLGVPEILALDDVIFTGEYHEHLSQVNLKWNVTSEDKINHYTIERAIGNSTFHPIGSQETLDNTIYHSSDINLGIGTHYYRLKVDRFDGSVDYSDIISFDVGAIASFDVSINPNPTHDRFTISVQTDIRSANKIHIHNDHGKLIQTIETSEVEIVIDCNQYPSGVYFVSVTNGEERVVEKLVVL